MFHEVLTPALEQINVAAASGVHAAVPNPFDWASPGWGPFGGVLKGKVGTFLGLFWLGGIIFAAFHFVHGVMLVAAGSETPAGSSGGVYAGRQKILWSAGSVILLGMVGTIFGIFLK